MTKKKDVKDKVKSHIKAASSLVVGYGVGELMGCVMRDFKPDAKGIKKLFIKIGAIALTGMVVKSACDYVEGEIDELFDTAEEMIVLMEEKAVNEDEADD